MQVQCSCARGLVSEVWCKISHLFLLLSAESLFSFSKPRAVCLQVIVSVCFSLLISVLSLPLSVWVLCSQHRSAMVPPFLVACWPRLAEDPHSLGMELLKLNCQFRSELPQSLGRILTLHQGALSTAVGFSLTSPAPSAISQLVAQKRIRYHLLFFSLWQGKRS